MIALLILVGVLVALVGAFAALKLWRRPGPKAPPHVQVGLPIIGTAKEFGARTVDFVKECQDKFGNAFTIDLLVFKQTFIFEEEDLKRFFEAPEKQLTFTLFESILDPLFGAMTPECKKAHHGPDGCETNEMKYLLHFLAPNIMKHITTYVEDVTLQLVEQWSHAESVDVFKEVSNIVLNANIRFTLGKGAEPHIAELSQLIRDLEETMVDPMLTMPGSACRRRAIQIRDSLHHVIGQKIWGGVCTRELNEDDDTDFDIRQFRAPFHADSDLIRMAIGIIFASHVNTVNSTAWALIDLCTNADWMKRCQQEQEDYLREHRLAILSDRNAGRDDDEPEIPATEEELAKIHVPFKFEDWSGFPVMTLCWRESVRLRSNMLLLRQTREDWPVMGGKYVVPKGEVLAVSPFLIGRDPQFWQRAEEYDPSRFEGDYRPINKYQFIQWGFGSHRCKGEKLGSLEAKVILATLLRDYSFELVDNKTPEMNCVQKLFGPPQAKDPVLVRVRPRK